MKKRGQPFSADTLAWLDGLIDSVIILQSANDILLSWWDI